ncbi:hypothetical protein DFH11DRAFT_1075964 [Phellopilus nigrolimitatus]|nr:hypothetical protein DFH11DRAFT_1075964 [Phellopilus nigrolimitatus]
MNFPNFTIVVNDTKPIWGYCRQRTANFSHCGFGMIFSINANPHTEKSFDAFRQLAVHQNGSGYMDPFGNIITSSATAYGSASGSDSKNAQGLDTLSPDGTESGSWYDKLNILLDTYAPVALGFLGGTLVLLLAVLVIGIMLRRHSSQAAARSVNPSYRPVPLDMPSSKIMFDGSHDYEEPRYSDR